MTRPNKPAPPKPVRCAVYTRKSTDEGLDREFNSLDTQRDAGEAFVRSQAGEGWTALPDRYDDGGFAVTVTVARVRAGRGGATVLRVGPAAPALPPGRVPRVARFMALAVRCDGLIAAGEVANYAELARLGRVTRARVTQVMNLLHLAPDVQEAILFLPLTITGRDPIKLADLQPVAAERDWRTQRKMWRELAARIE